MTYIEGIKKLEELLPDKYWRLRYGTLHIEKNKLKSSIDLYIEGYDYIVFDSIALAIDYVKTFIVEPGESNYKIDMEYIGD